MKWRWICAVAGVGGAESYVEAGSCVTARTSGACLYRGTFPARGVDRGAELVSVWP